MPEFVEAVAAYGQAARIGGEVTRDDIRRAWNQGAEVSASAEVCCGVHHLLLAKIRVSAVGVFKLRSRRVASVAVPGNVDEIAAEADLREIPARHVEVWRGRCKSNLDPRIAVASPFFRGYAGNIGQSSCDRYC